MTSIGIIEKAKARWQARKDLPVRVLLHKSWHYFWSSALSPLYLMNCTQVGKRARARGKPYVENFGRIIIGDDFNISSQFVATHLVTGPGGLLEIGDKVSINFGTGLCAYHHIRLGHRVRIGPYGMIIDTDFHDVSDHDKPAVPRPIVVGDDVWIAGRVTLLPGCRIGSGAVITAGSVVAGDIPPGVVAGGNPARVIRAISTTPATPAHIPSRSLSEIEPALIKSIAAIATRELGLPSSESLRDNDRPVEWDSLSQLRLLSAVEREFSIQLSNEALIGITGLSSIAQAVDEALRTRSTSHVATRAVATFRMIGADAFEDSVTRNPQRTAVVCDTVSWTYERFLQQVATITALLRDAGIKKGDVVLAALHHKPQMIASMYGVWGAGGVFVPLPENTPPGEISDLRSICHARWILHADDRALTANVTPAERGSWIHIGASLEKTSWKRVTVRGDDLACLMLTSGTTAKKKVVMLSHSALMHASLNIATFMRMSADLREYISVPVTHSFGIGRARTLLSLGATWVAHDGMFKPATMVQGLAAQQCNAFSAVPAAIAMFLQGGFARLLKPFGENIELIELGSASMPDSHKQQLIELFPKARICMHYGLTEASRSTFCEFNADRAHRDSIGKASPNVQIKFQDENGREVPVGEEGEIVVYGQHVASGYLDDPERSSLVFGKDGGVHTGDLGRVDAEGYVNLLGRKDDMINVGGVKVSPVEIEQKLRNAFPEIETYVVGIRDPAGIVGEVPAVVYLDPTCDLTLAKVTAALRLTLEHTKHPKVVTHVSEVPKTANGKVRRRELRAVVERTLTSPPLFG